MQVLKMIWIALAAQLSAPEPRQMWLSNDDTPVAELAGRASAVVKIRLTVTPHGRLVRCDIESSSGNIRIDNHTCDLALKRAQFKPARSPDGAPSYGVYRVPVIWAARPMNFKPAGDVVAEISTRPKGVRMPANVGVMFAVDTQGQISGCSDQAPVFPGAKRNNPALVPIACDRFVRTFKSAPATDERGDPVHSIQNANVLIVLKR
jgi:TonB family protein